MKLKLAVDVNITRTRVKTNECSYCHTKIDMWGVSFGSRNNRHHKNAWLHPNCVKGLYSFVSKYNDKKIQSIRFENVYISVVKNKERISIFNQYIKYDRYCSYCGKNEDGMMVVLRKKNASTNTYSVYCHISCLKKLIKDVKNINYQEIEDKILIEDV